MKVKLYTFDKKYNSTKRPTATGTEFECLLKTSSSIISPTLELNIGLVSNPSAYNYAYIQAYERYYWVSEWTFANTSWIASLTVDVLATWKPYIAETDMYVNRSSAEKNGSLIDNKYPMTGDFTYHIDSTKGTASAVDYDFTDGYYVVGVYGENGGAGSISYYAFTAPNYATFINQLYTNILGNDNIWNELLEGIRNSIFDISSYIKSCRWYIGDWTLGTNLYPQVSSIKLGTISIPCTARLIGTGGILNAPVPQLPYTITLTRHPQASSRGKYCNMKPYTNYKLVALPYGIFELDSVYMASRSYLHLTGNVDFITGVGVLSVSVGTDITTRTDDILLLTATCEYGVNIPISATITPNATRNVMMATRGLGGDFLTGMYAGAVVSAVSAVSPSLQDVLGESGGLASFNYHDNGLYTTFYTIASDDNNSNGRPLYAVRKPKNIAGYIEGVSNDFSCPATDSELIEIKRFIDNGFYYE